MAETTEDRADRPRRVIVLRHGQTDHNAAGIWQGQLDSHLSDVGRAQAADAAAELSAFAIDRVLASDLSRAAETGRVVAEAVGVVLEIDPRFREIHAGEWQGLTGAQVREQFPEDQDKLLSGEDFKRGRTGRVGRRRRRPGRGGPRGGARVARARSYRPHRHTWRHRAHDRRTARRHSAGARVAGARRPRQLPLGDLRRGPLRLAGPGVECPSPRRRRHLDLVIGGVRWVNSRSPFGDGSGL